MAERTDEQRAAHAAYMRNYYTSTPERTTKHRETVKQYRDTHPEYVENGLQRLRVWKEDPECLQASRKKYRDVYGKDIQSREKINAQKPERRVVRLAWRVSHRGYLAELGMKTRDNYKRTVFAHYSPGKIACALCGYDNIDALCIDHINNNGAAHRRTDKFKLSGLRLYTWLKKQNYPEGFQVLCSNCNTLKAVNLARQNALTRIAQLKQEDALLQSTGGTC